MLHYANYTIVPENFKSLWRQRVRWFRGFIDGAYKYRKMFLNKKYGGFFCFIRVPQAENEDLKILCKQICKDRNIKIKKKICLLKNLYKNVLNNYS